MPSRRKNAPSVPAALQRSASASNRRFSLPENLRRLAIATTSGSRCAASWEALSPVVLRAPSATASQEDSDDPFEEDFGNEVMCMSYLYSKLPETGVPLLIGTGGRERVLPLWRETKAALRAWLAIRPAAQTSHLFLNRDGEPMSRDGFARRLGVHVAEAALKEPSIVSKHVTPHVLRHYLPRLTMSCNRATA
jgi:hypothetical protein